MLSCRSCAHKLDTPFLSLGKSPLANSYLAEAALHQMEPFYPLELYVCADCFLVQLQEFESAEEIFRADYAYFSSFSDSWLGHCRAYADEMVRRFRLDQRSFVLEVGSNDGYLLQYFKNHQIPVLGVDPAANTANAAIEKGIPTEITLFSKDWAETLAAAGRCADLIVANNVLAHTPQLVDFVQGLKCALKPGGVITIEVPHLQRLMEESQFDTIYHEHFSYFSLHALRRLFSANQLALFDAEPLSTHGGSLRLYLKHVGDETRSTSDRLTRVYEREVDAGLLDRQTYDRFSGKVQEIKRRLLSFLIAAKNDGRKIAGYGAPAKGNTLLNYCGIRTDFLDFTVDRNPHKQGRFLPGTQIPVYGPERIAEHKPDYLLILPWNIRDEIVEQMAFVREWGCKFVVPIPELSVF